jgi:hypothetical protein
MSRPANALCEANLIRNWYVLFYAEATMTENNISPSINLAEHFGHSGYAGQKIIEANLAGIRPATNLKVSNRFLLFGLFNVLLVMLSTPAMATPIHVLFERDVDGSAGNELAVISYPTLTDLISNTSSFTQFTQVDVSAAFSVGGFYTDSKQGPSSQPVPEPGALSLLGFGLLVVTLKSRWWSKLDRFT